MRDSEYRAYLHSDEWKARVAERLKIDDYRCVVCGSRGTPQNLLQCHHLSYRHLGCEDVYRDLATLCEICHKNTHILLNRKTSPDRRGWKNNPNVPQWHCFTIDGSDKRAVKIGGEQ